jgi:peptide/nickel transport system substrate-binding protein
MPRFIQTLALAACVLPALFGGSCLAQQIGSVLKFYHRDSPASASIHEEATISSVAPFMGVFNNLVIFKQDEKQNHAEFIVPDLAESWSWNSDYTRLSFRLRQGVKWHDGQPFSAKDVKCTWDMLAGQATEKLRLNPRKAWYRNLDEVKADDDYTATFVLKRPQPAFLMLLASGMSPVYPCHVASREMRSHPIGTGPFKFAVFKPNEYIRLEKNTGYWKPGRPYLDAIEWTIIPNRSTQALAFVAGKFDMTFPYEVTVQMVHDIKAQAPQAICEVTDAGGNQHARQS